MASRKKTAKAEAAPQAAAPASDAQADGNAVEEVATQNGVNTYRVDMGESLPPQKPSGVE
jgi:hypothetical protein